MEKVICIKEAMDICCNDKEFFNEMVILLREDLNICLQLLEKAYDKQDHGELESISHRIKGQADNMASKDLSEKSKKVNYTAKLCLFDKAEYLELVSSINNFLRYTI